VEGAGSLIEHSSGFSIDPKYIVGMIDDRVLQYEPSPEEYFLTISTGAYQRLIFYKQELRERE